MVGIVDLWMGELWMEVDLWMGGAKDLGKMDCGMVGLG